MKKKKILILDDEGALASILASKLSEFTIIAPRIFGADKKIDVEAIRSALSDRPDLILLDVVWQSPKTAGSRRLHNVVHILDHVFKKRLSPPSSLKCCLVTAYRKDESDQEKLRDNFERVLGRHLEIIGALSKPLNEGDWLEFSENIRAAIDFSSGTVTFQLEAIPLPGRILNESDAVAAKNTSWRWEGDYPPPKLSAQNREFVVPDVPAETKIPSIQSYLKEYRLNEVKLEGGGKLQLALPMSARHSQRRDQLLKQIFALVQQSGFTRMRFFQRVRVPGSDGLLVLLRQFPKPSGNDPSPRHPLGGVILKQIESYQLPKAPKYFLYDIVSHEEENGEAQQDEGLQFWNKIAKTRRIKNWLRLPIICKYNDQDRARFQARGLLLLDKYGNSDTTILDDDVRKQEVSLNAACRQLARVLQREFDDERSQSIDDILAFYRETTEEISVQDRPNDFQKEFLAYACKCSDATLGRLYLTGNSEQPPISAAVYPLTRQFAEDDIVSIQRHPVAWQAWQQQAAVFLPSYLERAGSGAFESRLAMPLGIGGRPFGILSLRHPNTFHFNHRRVAALRRLIDLFVFPLNLAAERWNRRLWEISLAHSIKEINVMLKQEHILLVDCV